MTAGRAAMASLVSRGTRTVAIDQSDLQRTPLHALHEGLGAKMAPYARYRMPVQYPAGIVKEHSHTRSRAGWFDVSHMGQVRVAKLPFVPQRYIRG